MLSKRIRLDRSEAARRALARFNPFFLSFFIAGGCSTMAIKIIETGRELVKPGCALFARSLLRTYFISFRYESESDNGGRGGGTRSLITHDKTSRNRYVGDKSNRYNRRFYATDPGPQLRFQSYLQSYSQLSIPVNSDELLKASCVPGATSNKVNEGTRR